MNNLVELNTFKNIKLTMAKMNSNSRYYSLLGTNELLTEATLMISQILEDKITTEILKESQQLIKEMKFRAKTSSNLTANAIYEISRQLDVNVGKYAMLYNL